jgi:DNA-binding transcriptional ArsR family regulator
MRTASDLVNRAAGDRVTSGLVLEQVLQALGDPMRLQIVAELAECGEARCGAINLPISKSTASHHFRVLREAGLTAQRIDGKNRINYLRRDELEAAFPGLLDAVLAARMS